MIGQTVSHYRILDKIGEGGMGVVYRAHDTSLDRTVALKFLSATTLEHGSDKRRFIQEARSAASLHHPNICTIHEIDEHQGQMFIVMAYVEGENLQDRMAAGPLALTEAVDIVGQIAAGLQAAHHQGIVHRDIKPANIMLDPTGRALLMDFGLARRQDTTRLTRTGTTLGTFAYMSPEQLQGNDPDQRSDIWSLGAVLFEAVTGRAAFQGDLEPALLYAILNTEPGPVAEHRPEAPPGLDGIIARALAKNPEDRYQETDAIQLDLESLRKDPTAFPAGIPKPRSNFRKRLGVGAAVFTVLAAVAAAFLVPRMTDESASLDSLAVLPFANLSGDPDQDVYAAGLHAEVISTLGQVENLVVLGRRTVLKFQDSDLSPVEIASELGVAALLDGSVSLAGDRFKITAELVEASSGRIIWADSFDESLNDALGFQHRFALAVARGIGSGIVPALQEKPTRRVDPEAYRLYLKVRANWFDPEARATLKKVVEIDDSFAEAWAALAHRTAYSTQYGHIPQNEGYATVRQAAEKALELDPGLPLAHLAMATVHWQQDWDWEKAAAATKRAEALDPAGSLVLGHRAARLFATGRIPEGIAIYEEIIARDQLDPQPRQVLGWHLTNIGQFELAVEQFEKNLEVFPDHYFSRMLLGHNYSAMGNYEKAVEIRKELERTYEGLRFDADGDSIPETGLGPRWTGRGGGTSLLARAYANTEARGELVAALEEARVGYGEDPVGYNAWLVAFYLAHLGDRDEAAEWLEKSAVDFRENARNLTDRAGEDSLLQAFLYATIGDKDRAFEWLELAFDLRSVGLQDLYRRDYRFAELWSDERYEDLMRRRGFPEEVIISLRPARK